MAAAPLQPDDLRVERSFLPIGHSVSPTSTASGRARGQESPQDTNPAWLAAHACPRPFPGKRPPRLPLPSTYCMGTPLGVSLPETSSGGL